MIGLSLSPFALGFINDLAGISGGGGPAPPSNIYLRPDGTSNYFRPDGASYYIRP